MERPRRRSPWATSLLALIFASQVMMANGQVDSDLRLTGFESSRLAGTVEMHFFGQWNTICNDLFTLREAAVVCRQLGLGYPVRIFNQDTDGPDKMPGTTSDSTVSRFGFGSGIHAMDDVNCTGEEPNILSCSYATLGAHNCAIYESVGVQCSDLYPQPYSGQVRLVGGEFPSSGRLEVYFSGQWGAVCGEGTLDANLPTTVCRHLGFPAGTGQAVRYAQSVPVWLTSVSCSSPSTCLSSCLASAPTATQTCSSNTYITISCSHDAQPVRDYGTKDRCEMTSANPGEGSLRLVGGATNNTGVLQVYRSGRWGGICADGIQYDNESLDVACRQLGYRSWHSAGSAIFTDRPINIGRLTVDCNGGERRIKDCNIITAELSSCALQFHLTCSTDWTVPLYGAVLLTGGGGASGTLAVNGIGSLCDSPFSLATGDVACRQMGYEGARAVKNGSFYGSPAFKVEASGVCTGSEENFTACHLMNYSGTPTTAAGVQCIVNSSDSDRGNLRLVGGNSTAGRLQMQLDGEWTHVCSDGFSADAANVACSQLLGLGSTGTVHTDGRYGNTNNGTVIVQRCIGTEARLYDCWYYSVDSRLCTSDIALECYKIISVIVSCGQPGIPSNGRVDTSAGTSVGDVARYSCDKGYRLIGLDETTCQADGRWNGSVPTCELVSCGQPGIPINGRVNTSAGTSFGDVARYSCEEGYMLIGLNETTCQADGLWNGSVPTCEPIGPPILECATPPPPIDTTQFFIIVDLAVGCDLCVEPGVTVNIVTIMCVPRTSHPYDCIMTTPNGTNVLDINDPTHRILVQTAGDTVSSVSISPVANPDQRPLGFDVLGTWTCMCTNIYGRSVAYSTLGSCPPVIDCGTPQTFPKGNFTLVNGSTTLNSTVKYECKTGFQLVGSANRICQSNAQWSGQEPMCERVFCGQPDIPSNGRVDNSAGTSFGDVARYSCDTGYMLNGTAERTCQANGQWNGSVPTCERVSCGQLGDPINGRVDTSAGTSFGDAARYSCDTGSTLNGPAERTCQADGQWNGSVPTCEIITCGHLDPPRNGRVSTNAGTFGDVARYFCNEGYVFVPTGTCQADGQWSWTVPTCERVSCGQPEAPSNGRVNTSAGTSFGDVARYSCDTGYTRNGPAERTCQADGHWNGSVPSCLQCPPVCTHQYCSKRANRVKVCSLPGFGSCTGACKVTSCRACYYNDSPREIPSGCQQTCNGLTEKPLERCVIRWGACVRKKYTMLYSTDQVKHTGLFKCFEYPC